MIRYDKYNSEDSKPIALYIQLITTIIPRPDELVQNVPHQMIASTWRGNIGEGVDAMYLETSIF